MTDEDCSATRMICELVSRRAGFMAAAGITALLKKMDYHDVGKYNVEKRCIHNS